MANTFHTVQEKKELEEFLAKKYLSYGFLSFSVHFNYFCNSFK